MSQSPAMFLSCDWGTSSFRLRLVATDTQEVVAEEKNDLGIATVFKRWQGQPERDRLSFYLAFVQESIALLQQKTTDPLQYLPLIVSGMASSAIGMVEVGYKEAPFSLDGSDLLVKKIDASLHFPHDVYLISGVRTDDDVMRGEETQVVGCLTEDGASEQVIILPGTHSKHVLVKGAKAESFKTYMTGEFFELLSQKSILSVSVEAGGNYEADANRQSFEKGIADSSRSGLLHGCFRVRTNQLFGKMNKQENYYYLSGLLIGEEMRELAMDPNIPVTLVGNSILMRLYAEAFHLLTGKNICMVDETEATVAGQLRIYACLKQKEKGQ